MPSRHLTSRRAVRFARLAAAALGMLGLCGMSVRAGAAPCANPSAIGLARSVEIDASAGPIFGALTSQVREPSFLQPKEVVLTFDDGPMPWVTKSILDTLDAHCTKATFFSVGKMALAYPATVQDLLARGHTLGTHTYSHPFNMPRMKADSATSEIERGFAAVATAAGTDIAPFFRFTGLADSARLMSYLQTRGIAAFTVDVVSNDSYISDPQKLADRTVAEVTRNKGGIVLFHDIKTTTAKALPAILSRLQAQGYRIVHMTAKTPMQPLPDVMRDVAPKLAKVHLGKDARPLLPFYGAVGPEKTTEGATLEVASVAPLARDRIDRRAVAAKGVAPTSPALAYAPAATAAKPRIGAASATASTSSAAWLKKSVIETGGSSKVINADAALATGGGWATEVIAKAPARGAKAPR